MTTAKDNGINPTVLESNASHCIGGSLIGDCNLNPGLVHNIYIINGDFSLKKDYIFPSSQNYIFLINGNLNIKHNIKVPIDSTATFAVKGDIIVDKDLGVISNSEVTSIEGFYSTDKDFIINGDNNCTVGTDKRLNIGGTVVLNASLTDGKLILNRNLCVDNINYPVLHFLERVDFILNAPRLIQTTSRFYKEVAPR